MSLLIAALQLVGCPETERNSEELRRRAIEGLEKPRIDLKAFFDDEESDRSFAWVELTYLSTGVRKVEVGHEFDGYRLEKIVRNREGKPVGIVLQYIKTGKDMTLMLDKNEASRPMVPQIDGEWWQVAGNPDLGEYQTAEQEPVDFAVWQAADGTWQLWSCIRKTACGGHTRLFYRWEGQKLTDEHWKPMGIAMTADPGLGEALGGLQAPHVIRHRGTYYMFYGDWNRICLAKSLDGKRFERVLNARGQPDLFSGPYNNSRDPMVLKIGTSFYCYYTGHAETEKHKCAVFCRTSPDMVSWNDPVVVAAGGAAVDETPWWGANSECPFVVAKDGLYYLFRNQRYGTNSLNTQYCSRDPLYFGVDDDSLRIGTLPAAAPEIIEHEGQYYIAALLPGLDGIRIARLRWVPARDDS